MPVKLVSGARVDYSKSSRKDKKWQTLTPNGKVVHWGHPQMDDFTQHGDKERRKAYRKRAGGIRLKDGTRAIDKKWSPAWLAYHVTW